MEAGGYIIAGLNVILWLACGWPLAGRVARLSAKSARRRRPLAAVLLVYLLECIAFSASMATNVLSIALAVVWGVLLGRWLRRSPAETGERRKAALWFSLYSSLPAVSTFVAIPVMAMFGDWSILASADGFEFGIPAFLPWPLDTILGFSVAGLVTVVALKVALTTGLARAVMLRGREEPV